MIQASVEIAQQFANAAKNKNDWGHLYNVRVYGAVGDGITDDTIAFQNAISAAQKDDNGTVMIPSGTYIISSTLTITNRIGFIGMGMGQSILQYIGTGFCLVFSTTYTGDPYWRIGDFNIQSQTGSGIDAGGSGSLIVSNVSVTKPKPADQGPNPVTGTIGIKLGAQSILVNSVIENIDLGVYIIGENVWVSDVYISICNTGMKLAAKSPYIYQTLFFKGNTGITTKGSGVSIVQIADCVFDTQNWYGIDIDSDCASWMLDNVWISNTAGDLTSAPPLVPSGMRFAPTRTVNNFWFSNCTFLNTQFGGHGFDCQTNLSGGHTFTGCAFSQNKGNGAKVDNITSTSFTGCQFALNGGYGVSGSNVSTLTFVGGHINSNTQGAFNLNANGYYAIGMSGLNPRGINPSGLPTSITSGTEYQNTTGNFVTLYLPAYASVSGTNGDVLFNLGRNPGAGPFIRQFIPGSTDANRAHICTLRIPPGYYFKVTTTGANLNNPQYVGE